MTPEKVLRMAMHGAQAVLSAQQGDGLGAARHAIDAALEAIPADQARELLETAVVARVEAAARLLDDARFGAK